MSNPFRAIGGAYGQKWAFWAKNGRFRVSGDPRCHFLGALKAQTGHPGCVWQCPTLFNQCPTHLEPLEVPMCENGHHWQNMALFGASGVSRCHFLGAMRAKTYADTVPPFYLDNKWILGGCSSSEWGSLLRWEAFCLFDTLQKPVKKIPPSTFSIIWSEYGQKWYTLPLHVFISITYGHRTIAHAHFMHQALLPVSHSFFSLYICSPGNCESVLGSEVTDSVQQ